jgi:FkbM family methyltransferase
MREGDSIFIDVGAYTGFHTLKAYRILRRRHGSLIVAVEPVPQNYQALVRELPKADNIRTVRLAVWTCDDEDIEFYTGKGELSQAGSMTPIIDHMARGYLSDGTIKVRTIRLDTLVRRMGLSGVDLVKMDIESAECHVLTDPTLDLSSVRNLVVEVHYTPMSRESLEIVPSLNKEGLSRVYSTARARWHNYHLIATRYGEIPW